MYNFKALQSFITVADCGSFRKAAEQLNRSQSAVSMQVKQLEDQLGLALFHRTTRRTDLTPEGKTLLDYTRRALGEMDHGFRLLHETAEGERGQIAIACVPSIAASVLPPILKRFRQRRPNISLRVVEQTSAELLNTVARCEVDFAIGPLVEPEGDLQFRPIIDEPIVAVIPPDYRFDGRRSVTLAEICDSPVVLASTSAALRGNLDREINARGMANTSTFEVTHVQTMVAFAQAGLGIALVPAATLPATLAPDMQVLPITSPLLRRRICLISVRGASFSTAAHELSDLIVGAFHTDGRFLHPTTGEQPGLDSL